MPAIHLFEAKNVYTYEEIIGQEFLIPIPRGRIYTSFKERNGSKEQMFSSYDTPREVIAKCFAVTKQLFFSYMILLCYVSECVWQMLILVMIIEFCIKIFKI